MRPRSARAVASALERKGFEKRDNDHSFFHFQVDGCDVGISTKISHGERELGRPLLGAMKKQLKFQSSGDFERFLDCPMSEEEYVQHLRDQGHVE